MFVSGCVITIGADLWVCQAEINAGKKWMGFNRGQALISAMDLSRRATKVLLSSIKSQKDLGIKSYTYH